MHVFSGLPVWPVIGEKREFPLFVELNNELVIFVSGVVRKFRGSNFNLAPIWVLLMNLFYLLFIPVPAPNII